MQAHATWGGHGSWTWDATLPEGLKWVFATTNITQLYSEAEGFQFMTGIVGYQTNPPGGPPTWHAIGQTAWQNTGLANMVWDKDVDFVQFGWNIRASVNCIGCVVMRVFIGS